MRVTKRREEFGLDNFTMIERDSTEITQDLKNTGKSSFYSAKKKVLEMGLQAANQMCSLKTQTYFNRAVNACAQYDPQDFDARMKAMAKEDTSVNEKLDKFIDRVAQRVEEALQSNEIINVFQDDFDMLGDEDAAANTKISQTNYVPRTY